MFISVHMKLVIWLSLSRTNLICTGKYCYFKIPLNYPTFISSIPVSLQQGYPHVQLPNLHHISLTHWCYFSHQSHFPYANHNYIIQKLAPNYVISSSFLRCTLQPLNRNANCATCDVFKSSSWKLKTTPWIKRRILLVSNLLSSELLQMLWLLITLQQF